MNNAPSNVSKVGVRPEHLIRASSGLEGKVYHVEHLGGQTLTHLKLPTGHDFVLSEAGAGTDQAGETLYLAPAEGCLHAFAADGKAIR